jgi:hypothetical protein
MAQQTSGIFRLRATGMYTAGLSFFLSALLALVLTSCAQLHRLPVQLPGPRVLLQLNYIIWFKARPGDDNLCRAVRRADLAGHPRTRRRPRAL